MKNITQDTIKKNSIAHNAMLNSIKTLMSMIFPLITFPYISRIILVDNIGKVNFSSSIISYFVLLAGLGIRTYAIRTGAGIRDDKEKLQKFSAELLTINIISAVIAYVLLAMVVFAVPKLHDYTLLIAVQSLNIIGATLGVEWLYTIFEDYYYITIRSIAVQFISMVLLFTFVHDIDDYVIYAAISVFASTAVNIIGFIHVRKIMKLKLTRHPRFSYHMKSIMIVFAMSIATTIYVNTDTTMLGFICGDYYVGLYSAATKMYNILKSLIVACILVALPRLSNHLALNRNDLFCKEAEKIFNTFVSILLPIVVGVLMTASEIIHLIAGESYAEAVPALRILSISLVFAVIATYLTNVLLLPMKKEKYIMHATIASAVLNLSINFLILPYLAHIGAAITTLLAEFVVMFWQLFVLKYKLPFKVKAKNIVGVFIGCVVIWIYCGLVEYLEVNIYIGIVYKIVGSVLLYVDVLIISKHDLWLEVSDLLESRILHKR